MFMYKAADEQTHSIAIGLPDLRQRRTVLMLEDFTQSSEDMFDILYIRILEWAHKAADCNYGH